MEAVELLTLLCIGWVAGWDVDAVMMVNMIVLAGLDE